MASSTRQSRQAAEQSLNKLGKLTLTHAQELFAVSNALLSSSQLRAALSDPSAGSAGKTKLVEGIFGKKLSKETIGLVAEMSQLRWSATRDMALAAESLGVRAAAGADKDLDKIQAELFAVQQVVASDPELELAFSSTRATAEQKQELVKTVMGKKVSETTLLLATQAVNSKTYKRFAEILEQYGLWIAEFAGESVAHVRVANPLSADQLTKLAKALSKSFGRELQLNVEIDKEIIGGLHITVNGEVIDGTVQTKLQTARLQLG
ncbi:MAG: F0F1 ATP synthase subunit delta [Micrococcales bacterium]|mgnify:FL=1|nr:F0F1 ATP synthase subunit delta [Micrococcales bacterium]MBT5431544.1 F0F1 ATP synthase subunit delta [Micrococcales bacterium]MBT5847932.1 F0F1 ATP synthase subunit delta [Micrococcales bacterium]MBT7925700.1 F0F1 ATP synthase subunit delta [Micrococcales bacterium]